MANALALNLQNNLPKPKGGSGIQTMTIGKNDIDIVWKDGKVTNLISEQPAAVAFQATFSDKTMKEAVSCYKCWVNTETGDWICLPTQC